MLRCSFTNKSHLKDWFRLLEAKTCWNKEFIANKLAVSQRTVSNWQNGTYGMPKIHFDKLQKAYHYIHDDVTFYDEIEKKRNAGKMGGITTQKRGFRIGNFFSRRKGGYASLKTHQLKKTGFKLLKECPVLSHSILSAELIAVIIGDGHLSQNQAQIYLDNLERTYALYLQEKIQKLTLYKPSLLQAKENLLNISLSGKAICAEIHRLGVEYGNKTKKQTHIPKWILEKKEFTQAFLKGLFDTDGSLYEDYHFINGKEYKHWNVAITSYNSLFLKEVVSALISLGLHPTNSTKHRAALRRKEEVQKFIKLIRPANQKHLSTKFRQKYMEA